jgi:hypothetical protein
MERTTTITTILPAMTDVDPSVVVAMMDLGEALAAADT